MTFQNAGTTTHFIVQYDIALGAPAIAAANNLLLSCEADLRTLSLYMPYQKGGGGDPFIHPQIVVQLLNNPASGAPGIGGADNNGFTPGNGSLIRINPLTASGGPITPDFAAFLFVAEMAEILMGFYGWDAITSQGEALSRVMAEELHPASTANFVNSWCNFPEPRPDWISRNEGLTAFARGDLDPIAYGCGIIFIYFLRYQLGISYDRICGAGGTLLSDRYRLLTTATDDPAKRVGTLLDHHFGTGPFGLAGNNPFPLYDGADRKIFLAFGKPTAVSHIFRLGSGTAHIKPFFTCPAADYPFTESVSTVTQTITASTKGFGAPSFQWSVNGKPLFGSGTGDTVTATVDAPDPQNPDQPIRESQILTFDYKTVTDAAGTSSTLTLTNQTTAGDYHLDIQVECDEIVVPTGPVAVQQGITMHTRTVAYGGNYAADRQRCEKKFENATVSKVKVLQSALSIIKTLPDPPPPGYLPTVLEAAGQIREEIARVARNDHETATKLAQYAAGQLGVPVHLFLTGPQGSEAASST
jgi:hypothetical protein